jgi:hypothetical protein
MKILFPNPVEVITIPERRESFNEFNIRFVFDDPNNKTVYASIVELNRDLLLWGGAEYDTIGQWTDTDVINRIKELYS